MLYPLVDRVKRPSTERKGKKGGKASKFGSYNVFKKPHTYTGSWCDGLGHGNFAETSGVW